MCGPLDDEGFARLVSQGRIQATTLVWNETMTHWLPYAQARAASVQRQAEALATGAGVGTPQDSPAPLRAMTGADAGGAVAAIPCATCGLPFPPQEVLPINGQWVCAGCNALTQQALRESASSRPVVHYAGFWIRVVAKLVDGLTLFVGNLVVGFCIQGGFAAGFGPAMDTAGGPADIAMKIAGFGVTLLVQLVVGLCYTTFFLGRFGATPGKMACGLLVVRADGSAVTYGRAVGRHFADMLSGLTLCIGYLIAAFDLEKRALHDHICDTRVVHK
jgi:uncharacterized RDD family membrane protein YckC